MKKQFKFLQLLKELDPLWDEMAQINQNHLLFSEHQDNTSYRYARERKNTLTNSSKALPWTVKYRTVNTKMFVKLMMKRIITQWLPNFSNEKL